MKGKTLSIITIALLAASMLAVLPVRGNGPTTMYFNPSVFNGTLDLGDPVVTSVMLKDFTDLYTWQVEITWDPAVLDLVSYDSPYVLLDDVFDTLAPGVLVAFINGMINHVTGIFTYSAYSLSGPTGVTGTPGVGYKMMTLHFVVVGYGSSPIHYNKPYPEYTPPADRTYWLQSVGAEQPCEYIDGSATTKAPPAPYGPTALFTWYPTIPKEGTEVTFDATASKPGFNGVSMCPITEYRWDFDNDGVFEHNVTTKMTIHIFDTPGDYPVTLEVYAPGTGVEETDQITKTVKVIPPPAGAAIDLTSNKVPMNGEGPDVASDSFAPQELMILYAKVTYNDDPVEGKLVGFEVRDSEDNHVTYRTATTDSSGIAWVELRIPSMPASGDWIAIAIVDVAGTTVADTMPFRVGWIVQILSVTPDLAEYHKGEDMSFIMEITNIALTSKTVTLTLVIYDACGVPIAQLVILDWTLDPDVTAYVATAVGIPVPSWAFVSPPPAVVYANSFTALPSLGGVPTCPEVSAEFMISP